MREIAEIDAEIRRRLYSLRAGRKIENCQVVFLVPLFNLLNEKL